jgi:hypothetical protein
LLRERARKPIATYKLQITRLYGYYNAIKEETVQDDYREVEERE